MLMITKLPSITVALQEIYRIANYIEEMIQLRANAMVRIKTSWVTG